MKGIDFEKTVAAFQQRLSPDSEVLHNALLVDRLGHKRQFDVAIRGTLGGHEVIGVIECKDWARRVGPRTVESFVTKTRDLNANLALIVSRRGFTTSALETARDYGIGTLSLLPDDPEDSGFSVGVRAYGDLYRWTACRHQLTFVSKSPPRVHPPLPDLYWRSHRLLDWILGFLADMRFHEDKTGILTVTVDFKKRARLHTDECGFFVTTLAFQVRRERERKTRMLSVRGEAYFRWNEEKLTIPPKGTIETEWFRILDLLDWDDYEGEILLPANSLDFHLKVHLTGAAEERWDFSIPYSIRTDWEFDN
ncbi:restriction endonuclease [Candidatus Bipolaricaulota bacterium]